MTYKLTDWQPGGEMIERNKRRDCETWYVSGVGTVISYCGDGGVRIRDLGVDIKMTPNEARNLAQVLSLAADQAGSDKVP